MMLEINLHYNQCATKLYVRLIRVSFSMSDKYKLALEQTSP